MSTKDNIWYDIIDEILDGMKGENLSPAPPLPKITAYTLPIFPYPEKHGKGQCGTYVHSDVRSAP
jgi:hypothetical protein